MKKKVLLLSCDNATIRKLKNEYSHIYEFITTDVDTDVSKTIPKLNGIIKDEKPILIIGCSLGGFYTLLCDSGDIPKIVVNPYVTPYDGSVTHKTATETFENNKEYNHIKDKIKANVGNIFALLSTKDEVLGNTHINLFKEVQNETKYPYTLFALHNDFGHKLNSAAVYLTDAIYNLMYD